MFVYVERYGNGVVMSDENTDQSVPIDCGGRCNGDFYTWFEENITLRPVAGDFKGWEGCPPDGQQGQICNIPLDGYVHCLRDNPPNRSWPAGAGERLGGRS